MMTRLRLLLPSLACLFATGACGETASEIGLPCPCASGWVCCDNANVCVPEGDGCPSARDAGGGGGGDGGPGIGLDGPGVGVDGAPNIVAHPVPSSTAVTL